MPIGSTSCCRIGGPRAADTLRVMATKSPVRRKAPQHVYQLRIELQHIAPAVWRRIVVPETLTLVKLDRVIQAAMGWTNSHLHEFRIADGRYGIPDGEWPDDAMLDERRFTIGQLLSVGVKQFEYSYDFGDGWDHVIEVENQLPVVANRNTWPMCIAGENACPPEDVGGPPGYMDFIEAMGSTTHPQHGDMWIWWGAPFDAAGFSLNDANIAIRNLR